jgi:hypothetical protein
MEANLAIQMMNVAVQLLKGKGSEHGPDAAEFAAAAAAAAKPAGAEEHPLSPQSWPHVPGSCQLPFPGVLMPLGAAENAAPDAPIATSQPSQQSGQIGFKPQAVDLEGYSAGQTFSFPPNGPMPPGWPPASMVDQQLDFKLRPPAA